MADLVSRFLFLQSTGPLLVPKRLEGRRRLQVLTSSTSICSMSCVEVDLGKGTPLSVCGGQCSVLASAWVVSGSPQDFLCQQLNGIEPSPTTGSLVWL